MFLVCQTHKFLQELGEGTCYSFVTCLWEIKVTGNVYRCTCNDSVSCYWKRSWSLLVLVFRLYRVLATYINVRVLVLLPFYRKYRLLEMHVHVLVLVSSMLFVKIKFNFETLLESTIIGFVPFCGKKFTGIVCIMLYFMFLIVGYRVRFQVTSYEKVEEKMEK